MSNLFPSHNTPVVRLQTETDHEGYVVVTRAPAQGTMLPYAHYNGAAGQATNHTGGGATLAFEYSGHYPANIDINQDATEEGTVDMSGQQQPAFPAWAVHAINHSMGGLQDPERRTEQELASRPLTAATLAGVEQFGDMRRGWMPPTLTGHRFGGREEQPAIEFVEHHGALTHDSHRRTRRSRGAASHGSWVHVDQVSHPSRGSRYRSA
ncbi:hypothetical protein M406DRAFT_322756 [Cryphonectria parasitica EP155]|uniref:Uncharacterized protein n=1 Tax=Cryphonectria parasitica (strain ATCC 38755 / EP155) TaxID=660469 RepID=A0A9P4Y0Q0_CRYP1|nr:uncharacterized protein M406DRAFT_322756 [Cryphonectria parasitica EP155]KAF3764844.1 hypothetical protein M406DRAFT_322756 [Cryphonectria parasitica EP155]